MVFFQYIKNTDKQYAMRLKNYALFFATLLLYLPLFAQHQGKIYVTADQMPYFQGCEVYADGSVEKQNCSNQEVVTYLANNINYPEQAKNEGIEGVVYLSFVVDESGKTINLALLKDIGGGCGEEALRVFRAMPPWHPGILHDRKVKVQLQIPVEFRFSDFESFEDYTFRWGDLENYEISKKELKKNLSQQAQVFDEGGSAVAISSLTFSSNKKNKTSSAQSKGHITPQMKKLVKKLKKGSLFSVIATIQKGGKFIEIDKEFLII